MGVEHPKSMLGLEAAPGSSFGEIPWEAFLGGMEEIHFKGDRAMYPVLQWNDSSER